MRITNVQTIIVEPRWLFVKISTDEGIVGWGEALGDKAETIAMAIKELSRYLLAKDPFQIEHHWQAMYRGAFWRGGPILNAAISGVEIALWDILGKSLNVPIWQLLGGKCRDKIRVYLNIGSGDEKENADVWAKYGYSQGWLEMIKGKKINAIKFCPFGSVKQIESWENIKKAVETVKKIREQVGDGVDLIIECHGRLSPAMAVLFCEEIAPYHPFLVEEPCLPEDIEALAIVVEKTKVPIATGERIFTKFGFSQLLSKAKVAVIQPDLGICGGIMEGKKIAAMAEAHYIGVAPHSPYGPILAAASLQLDACIPNFIIQEYCSSFGEEILKKPFEAKDGYIEVPNGAGLGIEVDEDALLKRPYLPKDGPRLYHEDGSVADW
jgi:galactonate dehydratase